MNTKNKNILLGVLIVGVLSMTVAFAALSTRLNIQGTTNVAATKWNIHFDNWEKLTTASKVSGATNTAVAPEVSSLTKSDNTNITKVEGVNVTLNAPGDNAKYTFEIVNDGTIAAKLSNFNASLTPSSNVIDYEVKCYSDSSRTGTEVTQNSVLAANGGKAYCYLEVTYKEQTNAQTPGQSQVYTQSAINTSLSASWTWIQDDGSSVTPTPALTWDNYITPTQTSGGATLPDNSSFWIQENTTTKELCGVFPSGTVCLTNASSRSEEFTCDSNDENCTVSGYTLQKKTEMEQAGATSCSVYYNRVKCSGSGMDCYVYSYGTVSCRTSNNSYYCYIYDDGRTNCNIS